MGHRYSAGADAIPETRVSRGHAPPRAAPPPAAPGDHAHPRHVALVWAHRYSAGADAVPETRVSRGHAPPRAAPPPARSRRGSRPVIYREAGQFKTTYASDQAIFPIVQDKWLVALVVVAAFVAVPLVANEYW